MFNHRRIPLESSLFSKLPLLKPEILPLSRRDSRKDAERSGCSCLTGSEQEAAKCQTQSPGEEAVMSPLRITETVDVTRPEPETASASAAAFTPEKVPSVREEFPVASQQPPLTPSTTGSQNLAVMTSEDIFDLCTDTLVNSTVAKVCGRFFTGDIMKVMDICIAGKPGISPPLPRQGRQCFLFFPDVALVRNSAWSAATLPLLAAQCEADLALAALEWEETTSQDGAARFEPPFNLRKILNCQHACDRGRGFCNNAGDCVCFTGFRGRGCNFRAGNAYFTIDSYCPYSSS